MRSKVTVVLLFLNVVLFAYIYFYDMPRIRDDQTRETRRRVLGPEAATITALTRTSRTGETVSLEKKKDTGEWWLKAPYEWPADRNAIESLLNTLQLLEHENSFAVADLTASQRSLADYGLAEPALTLSFTSAEREYKIEVGDVTEVRNNLYLLYDNGSRIHVVNRSFAQAVGLPLDTLRSPAIFSVPVFEVRSLNVQTTGEPTAGAAPVTRKVRVRRDNDGYWDFEAPIIARASKTNVETTINAVSNLLTARSFLEPRDADLERTGLNSPQLQLTLEGNARRETLLLGNPTGTTVPREGAKEPDGEYFAKIEDNPVVFTTAFPADLLKVLRSAQEELRDPRVADFEPATVTSFTIEAPGQPELTLQRLEPAATPAGGAQPAGAPANAPATEAQPKAGWQAVVRVSGSSPQTLAADPEVIDDLLRKIAQLSAHEARPGAPKFLSDAPSDADKENWGFNRPERQITLNLNTGGGPLGKDPSTVTIQIGVSPDKPGEAFARTTNAPFVYQVLPDILDQTPLVARHYLLRVLRELPKGANITGIKLTALPDNRLVFEITNETAITPESLATAVTKPSGATAPKEPAATGLSEPARTVAVSLLGQLRKLRAKAFLAGPFTPDHAETPRGPQPWRYRLDVVTAFSAANGPAQSSTLSLLLTERIGGTTMLAGTAEFGGVVFEVTQELLDAIFAATYSVKQDPGPPAAPAATAPASAPAAPPPPKT